MWGGGGGSLFFSFDETQDQHFGHCVSALRMLGRAFALFLASQWGFWTEAYFVYIQSDIS